MSLSSILFFLAFYHIAARIKRSRLNLWEIRTLEISLQTRLSAQKPPIRYEDVRSYKASATYSYLPAFSEPCGERYRTESPPYRNPVYQRTAVTTPNKSVRPLIACLAITSSFRKHAPEAPDLPVSAPEIIGPKPSTTGIQPLHSGSLNIHSNLSLSAA
jgi:hypothetical protein